MSNFLTSILGHLMNAGSFNEGRQGQVSGDDLPPEAKNYVDRLAQERDAIRLTSNKPDRDTIERLAHLQQSINLLYNPRTRPVAMASWKQLHGDENDPWSATGGHMSGAASIVNALTLDPNHNYYGGRRGGPDVPNGARVAPDN